jgi:hypothetical protein
MSLQFLPDNWSGKCDASGRVLSIIYFFGEKLNKDGLKETTVKQSYRKSVCWTKLINNKCCCVANKLFCKVLLNYLVIVEERKNFIGNMQITGMGFWMGKI